jgi:hypothetical protein
MKLFDRRGAMTLPPEDYAILLREAMGRKSVLEFGPGFSTYAFIEAEVPRILCAEYLDKYFDFAKERFRDFPQIELIRFWDDAEATLNVDTKEEFELAFVDSPKGYAGARTAHPGQEDCSRLNTCLLALKHSPIVLLHDAYRPLERGTLGRLSAMGHKVSYYKDSSRTGMARIERCQKQESS